MEGHLSESDDHPGPFPPLSLRAMLFRGSRDRRVAQIVPGLPAEPADHSCNARCHKLGIPSPKALVGPPTHPSRSPLDTTVPTQPLAELVGFSVQAFLPALALGGIRQPLAVPACKEIGPVQDRYPSPTSPNWAPEPSPRPAEMARGLLNPDWVLDRLIFAADSGSVPQENLVTLGKEADAQGLYSTQPPRPDRLLPDFECTLTVETSHIEAR